MAFVVRFLSWVLRQLTFGAVLVAAGVVGFGLWIYFRNDIQFEQRRAEWVRALNGQRSQMRTARADVEAQLAAQRAEIARQQQRASEAARVAGELTALNSGLNRLTTPAEQIRQNEERLVRLRDLEAEARKRIAELEVEVTRAEWQKEGLERSLGRLEEQIAVAEAQKSRVLDFLRESWTRYGWYVVALAALLMLGPALWRLTIYFIVAPFVSRRRPLRLRDAPAEVWPELSGGATALELSLEPGDVLWVKEVFLHSSEEALARRTRWLLDWRMPFTCLAGGLKELVELRNPAPEVALGATLSSQASAHVELAVLAVPAGASIVLRPSFLAGFVGPLGRRGAAIRKHWRIFSLQAWATGQFRFFEFVGPCRLVLAGSRGVRAERLGEGSESSAGGARRVNQDATIGFAPTLGYRPVRAETFWAYFRGQNPLFDDLFEGRGLLLAQQTSAKGEAAEQRRFLAGVRDGVLRIFGL